MKSHFNLLLWAGILLTVTACTTVSPQTIIPSPIQTPSSIPTGPNVRAVFEGITPCSRETRPLPQIPADTNCEQMIWKIILYQDSATGTATTYTLESAYGVPQPNTPGLAGGGTPIAMEGKWAIVKGTKTDPETEVYQLHSEDSQIAVSFLKMSEDILHVLNRDQTMMVGNGAWSYTLNRTDNQIATPVNEPARPGPESTRPPIPPVPAGSSVLGAFEGRLPCHDIVFEMLEITPYPGCAKLKTRVTLYLAQNTGTPSTYMSMGTSTIQEGTWTIIQGTENDPDAVIYQLDLGDSQQPASFLRADDNHLYLLDRARNLLVGNALFSYTLSRVE
jgi:hypothetical protein